MEGQFEVASHEELGIEETICRICRQTLTSLRNRVRHEREKHKLVISKNVTLSPIPTPLPRHQSCPTPTSDPLTTPKTFRQSSSSRRILFRDVNFNISPPIPMSLPTSSASKMSISTVESSQSLQTEDETAEDNSLLCSSCNHLFSNKGNYNKHLPCRYEVTQEKLETNPKAIKLCPPLEREAVKKLLQHLTTIGIMELSMTQNWCFADFWPLVFVGSERSGASLFKEYTANIKSIEVLKQFLSIKNEITLPRCILIVDTEVGLTSMLSGSLLRPPDDVFNVIETEGNFIVRRAGAENICGGDGDGGGGGDSEDDSDDSEDEDDGDDDLDNDDESDSDEDCISHAHQPQQHPFATLGGFQNIQHLLPGNFDPGVDGQGNNKDAIFNSETNC